MSRHFGNVLTEQRPHGIPKKFDIVSADGGTAGDAKYLTLVQRHRPPSLKFVEIAGHVWLLERALAERRFLVFGNQHSGAPIPLLCAIATSHLLRDGC